MEENYLTKSQSIPIEVGSGETIYTLGTTEIILVLGEKAIKHKMHVLETSAFQAVLGMDFPNGPRCTGIVTFPNPLKIIVDGEQVPLRTKRGGNLTHGLFRIFKKEA